MKKVENFKEFKFFAEHVSEGEKSLITFVSTKGGKTESFYAVCEYELSDFAEEGEKEDGYFFYTEEGSNFTFELWVSLTCEENPEILKFVADEFIAHLRKEEIAKGYKPYNWSLKV